MGEIYIIHHSLYYLSWVEMSSLFHKSSLSCVLSALCLHIKYVWWHAWSPLGSILGRQPKAVGFMPLEKLGPMGRGPCGLLLGGMVLLGDQASDSSRRWNFQMLREICFEIRMHNGIVLKTQCGPVLWGKTKTHSWVLSSPQAACLHSMD